MRKFVAGVGIVVALGGGGDVSAAPTEPAAPLTVTIDCHEFTGAMYDPDVDFWEASFTIDRRTLDFSEVWATPFPEDVFCDVSAVNGSPAYYLEQPATDMERANWEATEPQYQQYTLGISYEQCVEHGTERILVSVEQVQELFESLEFCPDHPDRAAFEQRAAELGVEQVERDEGVRFGSGLYRVGEDIQPGTYFSESDEGFENCYWERQDSAGNIIDNNFAGRVFRVEVTIADTDYAFLTEGCGEWSPLE